MTRLIRLHAVLLSMFALSAAALSAAVFAAEDIEQASTVGKAPSPPEGARPEVLPVARGKILYARLGCPACHGFRGQGGANNAPDLGQSGMAVRDDAGKSLAKFLLHGRPARGMPPAPRPLTSDEAADLSARMRWLAFAEASLSGNYGGPPLPVALAGQNLSIVVGDAKYGRQFFEGSIGKCASCHAVEDGKQSAAVNLAHIAAKYPDTKDLQDNMLLMTRPNSPEIDKSVTAIISFRDGRTMTGYLDSVSDFKVAVREDAGKETIIPRNDGEPKVVLVDQLQAHIDLLRKYQDNDIHNLTAYLATLK